MVGMRAARLLFVCTCALVLSGCLSFSRNTDLDPVAQEFPPVPAMVVLDASGSMKADDAPGVRFAAAQRAVEGLVDVLPEGHEVGMIAYGTSTGSSDAEQEAGCRDISTVVPFGALDKPVFTSAVNGLKPAGYTPIGTALEAAAAELPSEGERAIVLVSDGIDTCAPDGLGPEPCVVADALGEQGVVVHTLGFKVVDDPRAGEQLDCIAQRSKGLRLDATNGEQLRTRLRAAFNPALVASSVQPSGYRGLTPGMSVAEARRAAPKLPEVTEKGRIEIVYVDCTIVFEDGVLVEIVSTSTKAPTLDGVKVGDDIVAAEKIYGSPDAPSAVSGDGSVTYPADPAAETGYRIEFERNRDETLAGKITRIVLCRCMPVVEWGDDVAAWKIGPGYLGPLRVGMPMSQMVDGDWAVPVEGEDWCDAGWDKGALPDWTWFEATRDEGNESRVLGGVHVRGRDDPSDRGPRPMTVEGAGIGTSVEDLRRIYGDRIQFTSHVVEGGEVGGYVLFGRDGALMFNTTWAGMPDVAVASMTIGRGTTVDTMTMPVGGC